MILCVILKLHNENSFFFQVQRLEEKFMKHLRIYTLSWKDSGRLRNLVLLLLVNYFLSPPVCLGWPMQFYLLLQACKYEGHIFFTQKVNRFEGEKCFYFSFLNVFHLPFGFQNTVLTMSEHFNVLNFYGFMMLKCSFHTFTHSLY